MSWYENYAWPPHWETESMHWGVEGRDKSVLGFYTLLGTLYSWLLGKLQFPFFIISVPVWFPTQSGDVKSPFLLLPVAPQSLDILQMSLETWVL